MPERLDSVGVHLDSLKTDDLLAIRESLLEYHRGVTEDIDKVEQALLRRNQPELFDATANYEKVLGDAMLRGEIDASEAYEALGDF